MAVDLHPGEIRGYWKQRDSDLWFKTADREGIPAIQKLDQIKEIRHEDTDNIMLRENGSDEPRSLARSTMKEES
ncbi:Hypothetical protein PHPALM_11591 [Phytophthora palmivora]|uniref:Uncharacterized protein n=1 Tax=Phytophthora palmivora TaxID=4796 RepID=A0A2P4Y1V1_9STRA|nr:Hypothetical protein PHPALM_11591 [Phytophthora palmivora]